MSPGALGWLVAVESASESASVALLRDGEPVAARAVPRERPASEALLPALLALLAEHGLEPAGVDAWAVSVGPGSFTGLRVGVATVKGLAFGEEARVVAVPTLAALAACAAAGAPAALIVATLDARRGELYAAAHRGEDPSAAPLWGPTVVTPEALAARLAGAIGSIVVAGEGVRDLAPTLAAARGPIRIVELAPDAAWVGRLGARLLAAGHAIGAAELAPVYVRRAEAEVRRTGASLEPV